MKQPKSSPATRILFIGNSFTFRNDLPGLLTAMAASGPQPRSVETSMVVAGGASLRQHWNSGAALESLRQGSWDYVVLQEQSTLPIKNAQRFQESARLLHEEIEQHGAQTVFYLTWARQAAPESQEALNTAYLTIARELQSLVAPVGIAWQSALQEDPKLPLYDTDGSHPSPTGSYVAACVFYATLFNASPVGVPVPATIKVNAADASLIQRVAWQTVQAVSTARVIA
ncbi:MAG: SGNH/GDSL hydrolase family protein [Armatimonadota bacterium]|nr:SGNH/GDSL hydrolase family protein [Armatimonadota bacterium]